MTNNKRKNFDVGDHVVITHEASSTVYLVVGVKGNKLGVIDPIRALVVPGQVPMYIAAELFEVPLSFQMDQFNRDYGKIERMMQAKALGENLAPKYHGKCDHFHGGKSCDDPKCWLTQGGTNEN